jgi:hypothetical protein
MPITLSSTTRNAIPYNEEGSKFSYGAVADAILPVGTVVSLLSTGKVAAVTAYTDVQIGVVIVPNTVAGGMVTVQTKFTTVVNAVADGTVAIGAVVDATGNNGSGVPKFKATATGGNACGIALTGGATTVAIKVGLN